MEEKQWDAMCRKIKRTVKRQPGITIDELLDVIKQGCKSSPRYGVFGSSKLAEEGIVQMVKLGCLKGVKIKTLSRGRLVTSRHRTVYTPTFYVKGATA